MGPFSALLPVSGGIAPTTGMAQEEAWSSMCPQVALQTDSDPAMLSGETLQALWHQKQDRNVTGPDPSAFPVPFFWLQHSLLTQHRVNRGSTSLPASPLVGQQDIYLHMKANRCKSLILCLIGAEFIFQAEKCLLGMIYNPGRSVGVGN